jgi:hypothetical protein
MEKICTKCKGSKEIDEFNKNKSKVDGYNNICRECSKTRSKQYYSENTERHKIIIKSRNKKTALDNRRKIFEYYKTHPCIDCGESDPMVLEFDHRDGVDKLDNVSTMVRDYSWGNILKEIKKCDVRCANCHRRRTAISQGWYKEFLMGY